MSVVGYLARTTAIMAVLAGFAQTAQAQAVTPDAAAKAHAREIAEAVAACDKGAASPMDYSAKAAPVQYAQLFPADFDMTKLKELQRICQIAWAGAEDQPRLHLQWMRVTVAIGEANLRLLVPQLRKMAEAGTPEAQFLLYQIYRHRQNKDGAAPGMFDVSKDEAVKSILAAAEQGHIGAIYETMLLYRGAYEDLPRDFGEVVRWARRLESAPPQGSEVTPYELELREWMPAYIARTTLEEPGFSETETRAAYRQAERIYKAGGANANDAGRAVAEALRIGRGTSKNAAAARKIFERLAKSDRESIAPLAEMLARGEGGERDARRALDLVRAENLKFDGRAKLVEADILLAGDVIGYRPQQAIRILADTYDIDSLVRLARLLTDYNIRIERPDTLLSTLSKAAAQGRHDAVLALAELKLSNNSQFGDEEGARALLKPLADARVPDALWLYAATQYRNLDSSSMRATRREDGLSDAELMALIDDGIDREEPRAFLLKAKFLRAGILYPQDDRGASDMLRQAARGDNIEALLLLGDAYSSGLGIEENPRARLDAWRRAARLGSMEAKEKITRAFTFDTFDKLMTLEEGVTWRIALYNTGYGRSFMNMGIDAESQAQMAFAGLFSGRAMEGGIDAVAEAVMNGFRDAPEGLDDANLVAFGKSLPDEIRIAIERKLASDGFFDRSAQGYWGPDARKALADWVEAQGYRKAPGADQQGVEVASLDAGADEWLLDAGLIERIRADATKQANAARTDRQKRAALERINLLARYGDTAARWALVPNYHQVDAVRRVVSIEEITRYGIDMMVTRPPGAEKADFDFIFNTTQIYTSGGQNEFGKAVIATIRDDRRLHDPLVLGGVLKQFIFAPGACEAVLAAANRAQVQRLGDEGCDDKSLAALVAFARDKGPSGVGARNRRAAAEALKNL